MRLNKSLAALNRRLRGRMPFLMPDAWPEGALADEVTRGERAIEITWNGKGAAGCLDLRKPRPWEFIRTWDSKRTRAVQMPGVPVPPVYVPPPPKPPKPPKPKRKPYQWPHRSEVKRGEQGKNILPVSRSITVWNPVANRVCQVQIDDPWDPVYCRVVMMAGFRGAQTLDYFLDLLDRLGEATRRLHEAHADAWEWVPMEWLVKTKPQNPWWAYFVSPPT